MALTPMDLVATAKQNIREVGHGEAQALAIEAPVIDVREPAEFVAGSLPGAINIPRGVLEFQIGNHPKLQGAQDRDILVYCQSGGRSALAVEALQKLGYGKAVSLAGGYKAWQEAGLPTASTAG